MNHCIFCRNRMGDDTSQEHIVPESLGNKELILPKGTVCNKCNNETLAKLDNHFLEFELIKFARAYLRIPNKAGELKPVSFGNMIIIPSESGIKVNIDSFSSTHFELLSREGDVVKFKLKMIGRKNTISSVKTLVRALYKMAFEILCLDLGTKSILNKKYDPIRDIILGKKDFSGNMVIITTPYTESWNLAYNFCDLPTGKKAIICQFNFFGTIFIFDLENHHMQLADDVVTQLKAQVVAW